MKKIFFKIFVITLLWACDNSISFENPQPLEKRDLLKIPKKLTGTYISTSDSTFLTIDETQMVEWVEIETKTLADSLEIEIDSTEVTENAQDSIKIVDGKYNLKIVGLSKDSVLIKYSYRDTIFSISNDQVLRRFKGHFFLNYRKSDNKWKVQRLTLENNGELSFSKIRMPEDIESLREVTEVKEIKSENEKVLGYKLDPTRKELKQLMKHKFSETKKYKKINLSI